VFPARYELNSYIVFGKRLVSKRLSCAIRLWKYSRVYNNILEYKLINAHVQAWLQSSQTVALKYVILELRPPLWSSGQSSWLQILRPGFRFPALPEKK
jgi:hypothetical protein